MDENFPFRPAHPAVARIKRLHLGPGSNPHIATEPKLSLSSNNSSNMPASTLISNVTEVTEVTKVSNIPPNMKETILSKVSTASVVSYTKTARAKETDAILHIPDPTKIPPLPLLLDRNLYENVLTVPYTPLNGDPDFQDDVLGDQVMGYCLHSVLTQEFGHLVHQTFDDLYTENLLEDLCNEEQAAYYAFIYDLDSRMRPSPYSVAVLTPEIKARHLCRLFYAYIGAIHRTRGMPILKRFLRDLVHPIIIDRNKEIVESWPKGLYEDLKMEQKETARRGDLRGWLVINMQDYEGVDCHHLADPETKKEFGLQMTEECCDMLLKHMRRNLKNACAEKKAILRCIKNYDKVDNSWTINVI